MDEAANSRNAGESARDPGNDSGRDEELLRGMLEGDEEAFAELFRRERAGVYQFALHMSGSASAAEDVTQEVFLILLKTASRYDPTLASLRAFLYGIARNCVRKHQERGWRYVPIPNGFSSGVDGTGGGRKDDPYDPAAASGNPLRDLARSEQIESVRQAVLSLPAPYREAVVLCELQELSYAEAAVAAGCSLGTIRSRLHRARALLAKKLEGGPERATVPGRTAPKRCPA